MNLMVFISIDTAMAVVNQLLSQLILSFTEQHFIYIYFNIQLCGDLYHKTDYISIKDKIYVSEVI